MKEMDARMDAFAKLKGTLAQGPHALLKAYQAFDEIGKLQYRLYRYPQLQRDVDTRDQAVAGRFQRMSAVFAKFDDRVGVVHARAAQDPGGDGDGVDRADACARAVSLPDPRRLPAQGARARRQGRAAALARRPVQRRARDDLPGAEHLRHQVPDAAPRGRQRRRPQPGNYAALLEKNRDQAERGKAAAAHVGTYGATANTYAAIYNGTLQRDWFLAQCAQLRDHARCRARRQRDPARRRRDADRRDPRRLGAVPALRPPAPEAARPAELPPLRRLPADLPQRQVLSLRAGARPRAARRSRRSATTT